MKPPKHTTEQQTKLPPHDVKLETAVLGAAILEAPALRKALELLPDEQVFYRPEHIAIWQALRALFHAGQQIDMLTVVQQLRTVGKLEAIGGPAAVLKLTERITSGANIEAHSRLLQQLYARRLTQQAARQLLAGASDDTIDPLELYAEAQNTLTRLTRSLSVRKAHTAADLYDATFQQITTACTTAGLTGIPTGYQDLDQLTGGWKPGNLILLAARPGMGKTTAALAFARNAAVQFSRRVLFVSLEMPEGELMMKLVASEVNRTTFELSHGKLGFSLDEKMDAVATIYNDALTLQTDRLIIDPSSSLTTGQLRARAAELKAEPAGLDLVIIDYVQLLKADTRGLSREEQVAEVSRSLKALALELAVPVIALAQLNREAEKRADKRPQTSDLRESGQLEQDADVIIFPWRGEVYDVTEYADGSPTDHTILFDFAKNRNGPVGEVILGCDIARGRFWDLQDPPIARHQPASTEADRSWLPDPTEEPAF